MKQFNLRQVKREHEQAAKSEPGSAGERNSHLARTGPSDPGPLFPSLRAVRGPHPGPGLPRRPPRPAPRPCPGLGVTTAGRRRARASWRLTSPGCARPSMEVCSAGSRESGGRGGGPAGLGPRTGRPRGQSRGLRGLPSRDLSCGLHQAARSLRARPILQEREPKSMSGFVSLRARGLPQDDGDFLFSPQLGEKTRQRQCGR